ncbi:amphi-Trp domain-containing protein [uncultured Celeribacter sp.]|uniref:amphi-Trp domain-containing protein n=1 Tax=uncultured Celeribacter sp. TaxID=1303376 RepID=UPI002AA95685|nr:amphi-Trp domain-containing protein [uncultured Celeribacter sp.]
MSGQNAHFSHDSLQDAKTIKTLLTALSKGFSKGEMTLGDDENELVLQTAGLMNVRIKASREDGQCQINLRVSWSDPVNPGTSKGSPKIKT